MGCTRVTTLALTATALAIAGCGGSSSKALTRAELTAKADVICKHVSTELASANKQASSVQAIAQIAPKLSSLEQAGLAELSKLTPPSELANDWKTFVAGAQTLSENTAKLGEYAKANKIKEAQVVIVSSEKTQQQMVALAKKDGLTACVQVP
jgi:hypothetical protein